MKRIINLDLNKRIQIAASADLECQLMVCSHERSGTHFLMNSIGAATDYCSSPWLNYDLIPLGADVNFYSKKSVRDFIKNLSSLEIQGIKACNSSILKSHFPLSMLGETAEDLPLKILYIYRDPAEVFTSFWKFLHNWEWDEGPKAKTPSELLSLRPSGQSQRYQVSNYRDYFERWAQHTIDGIHHCEKNKNAFHLSYKDLLKSHEATTAKACKHLGIRLQKEIKPPDRAENVINGKDLPLSGDEKEKLRTICRERLREIPELEEIFNQES